MHNFRAIDFAENFEVSMIEIMLTNKASNKKFPQVLFDLWDTKIQFNLIFNQETILNSDIPGKNQRNYQKNHQKFIIFNDRYKKSLNKDLNLRYKIDRLEQNKCNIDDYNRKVILSSSLRKSKFYDSKLGNKIFDRLTFTYLTQKTSSGATSENKPVVMK